MLRSLLQNSKIEQILYVLFKQKTPRYMFTRKREGKERREEREEREEREREEREKGAREIGRQGEIGVVQSLKQKTLK